MAVAERRVEALAAIAAIGGAARGAARASLRASPRVTLAWALGASAIVHAGFLVAPLAGNGGAAALGALQPAPIQVALASAHDAAPPASDASAFVAVPMAHAARLAMHRFARVEWAPAASGARTSTRAGVPIDITVPAEPVVAMTRIGDEQLQRFGHEFPAEVAWPVRIRGELRAHYPAAARDAGREGDVLLWVVVEHTGDIAEVKVIEGDADLAQAAVDAANAAQYMPASDDTAKPIRYPIALEFRFTLPAGAGAVTAAVR